ncbi:Copper-exporting P-type ATPase A [Aquisphaera giovannonii]|uniref:Copper-exporting P-type ATPase A n=1 Tax=Aquisphaera giovannonii TaxID=406548 RepID=A0A5B9W819_9BACT|nr:cation-translocating P-type ATPase [Aquisphaera giovannonii]QEH36836.1 Copper-exporting P-type ATPase A [Aquisphaera giovannonii]
MRPRRPDPRPCEYCQSPVPSGWWKPARTGRPADGPVFCCLGCRMAAAIIEEHGEAGAARSILTRLGLSIFSSMNVMAFTMALWTTDVYEAGGQASPLMPAMQGLLRHVVLLFSLPVLYLLGLPLASNAWESLRRGVVSTDALLALGVGAAFATSVASVLRGEGPIYFEVGCVILVMTALGRWLEAAGRLKASSALDALSKLLPATVRRISDGGEESIPIALVAPGDRLRILPGERFPADGRVITNAALVDEQLLTGESRPAFKDRGSTVLGGTLDLDGDLVVEVTAAGAEATLARVVELVRQARMSKGRYQRLVDRISAWFFPVVGGIALLSFLAHWYLGSLEQGLMAALAVSLIACPCALGLATPLAVWSAIGQAARHQVLFRSGEALERLADIRAIRFDKTGTLTSGTAAMERLDAEEPEEARLSLARAAALARSSSHALSTAIVEHARNAGHLGSERIPAAEAVRVIPGLGIVGDFPCEAGPPASVALGSMRLMESRGLRIGTRLAGMLEDATGRGLPVTLVGWGGGVRGVFVFEEEWREGFDRTLDALRHAGLDIAILTGDHPARGRAIASELGVAVEAGLLPEQKVDAVRRARRDLGAVAMVGDGVNDAPALAASDVGIAMGCGTDVSRDSASVCLLGNDLARIPWSLELARRTVSVIKRNLFWAFGYNVLGVVAAAMGWLNPAIAALLMVASSGMVIGNSLRLRGPLAAEAIPSAALDDASAPDPGGGGREPSEDCRPLLVGGIGR